MEPGQPSTWPEQTCVHLLKVHSHYRVTPQKEMNNSDIERSELNCFSIFEGLGRSSLFAYFGQEHISQQGATNEEQNFHHATARNPQQLLEGMEQELAKFSDTLWKPRKEGDKCECLKDGWSWCQPRIVANITLSKKKMWLEKGPCTGRAALLWEKKSFFWCLGISTAQHTAGTGIRSRIGHGL